MKRVILALGIIVACDATANQAPEVPETPKTDWHVCALEGAMRRLRCPRHFEPCVMRLSALSLDCYREVWRAHDNLPQDADLSPLGPHWAYQRRIRVLGPDGNYWFGNPGDPNFISKEDWADGVCKALLPKVPLQPCVDEIVFGIGAVKYGGFGVGP